MVISGGPGTATRNARPGYRLRDSRTIRPRRRGRRRRRRRAPPRQAGGARGKRRTRRLGAARHLDLPSGDPSVDEAVGRGPPARRAPRSMSGSLAPESSASPSERRRPGSPRPRRTDRRSLTAAAVRPRRAAPRRPASRATPVRAHASHPHRLAPTATPRGRRPTSTVATTSASRGSIRDTVPSSLFATQTAPAPWRPRRAAADWTVRGPSGRGVDRDPVVDRRRPTPLLPHRGRRRAGTPARRSPRSSPSGSSRHSRRSTRRHPDRPSPIAIARRHARFGGRRRPERDGDRRDRAAPSPGRADDVRAACRPDHALAGRPRTPAGRRPAPEADDGSYRVTVPAGNGPSARDVDLAVERGEVARRAVGRDALAARRVVAPEGTFGVATQMPPRRDRESPGWPATGGLDDLVRARVRGGSGLPRAAAAAGGRSGAAATATRRRASAAGATAPSTASARAGGRERRTRAPRAPPRRAPAAPLALVWSLGHAAGEHLVDRRRQAGRRSLARGGGLLEVGEDRRDIRRARYGHRPVRLSNSRQPSAYTSARPSTARRGSAPARRSRPCPCTARRPARVRAGLGEPEVGQVACSRPSSGRAGRSWLYVPVHEAPLVRGVEGVGDLRRDREGAGRHRAPWRRSSALRSVPSTYRIEMNSRSSRCPAS